MAAFPDSIGPFKIDSQIGSGSCGRVFKAFDQRLSRWVAIKLLYAYQDHSIEHEARLLASISHPNIVSVFDIIKNEEEQWTALVMEYLPGNTLENVFNTGKTLSIEQALVYCLDIAKGLCAAHQLGIIHRDLKPENIFFDSQGHLKIGDFGIANVLGEQDPNAMLGSLNSLSPEQVLDQELSPQSDLFSLGLLLYQMLTNRHPFEGEDGSENMLKRLVNDAYNPINCENEQVLQLVKGLLAKLPAQRFTCAQDVIDKIQHILELNFNQSALPTLKQNNPLVAKVRCAQKKKHRQWLLVILVTVIITGAVFGAYLWPTKPRYVVVLPPVIETGEQLQDIMLVQTAVFQAATEAINDVSGNLLVPPGEISDVSGSTDDISKILNITAANELLFTQLNCIPNQCAITFSRWQGQPATLISQHSIQVPINKLLFVADYVQNYLSGIFGDNSLSHFRGRPIPESDYRQFLLLENKHQQGDISLTELISSLEGLNKWDCDFEALCQLLLRSYLKKYRYELKTDWLERTKKMISLAKPGNSKLFLLSAGVEVATIEKDYAKADVWLTQLEQEHLTDPTVVSLRARWYFDQGFNIKGKSLMAELVAQRPAAQHLYNYAVMLFRLDENAQSMSVLKQLLKQMPDHTKGLELHAALLLLDGQWQAVINTYKQLIILDKGENPHVQNNMGLAYLMINETAIALQYFEHALAIAPSNQSFLLNLASSQLLSGYNSLANSNYRKITKELSQTTNKSIDDNLVLAEAYARLRQKDRALETLLNVLQSNINNKFVLYNIALIYLLLDDIPASVDYIEQALAAGLSTNWLQLPFFNKLLEYHQFTE